MKLRENKNVWVTLMIFSIICATTGIVYAQKTDVYNTLNAFKLIPQPETFTELYFNNASSLPRYTVQGGLVSFSFTIHNVENATTTYPYRVYFEYPDNYRVTFTSGNVTLADNASTTIAVSHTFLATNEHGMVVVALTSLDQTIDFLLPDTN